MVRKNVVLPSTVRDRPIIVILEYIFVYISVFRLTGSYDSFLTNTVVLYIAVVW